MPRNQVVLLNTKEGRELARKACRKAGITLRTLEQLLAAEADQQGKLRKRGLKADFDEIFDEASSGDE